MLFLLVRRFIGPYLAPQPGFTYNFISAYLALKLGAALVDNVHAHWYISVFVMCPCLPCLTSRL
jgi:hypothetical protein